MSSSTESMAPVEKDKSNFFSRIVGVLFEPTRTFESIARRPDWILPLLLITLLTAITSHYVASHLDLENSMRAQFEEQKQMTPEQIDKAIEFTMAAKKFSSVIGMVTTPLFLMILAALLLLILKIFGAGGTFKQLFSISIYGWIPQVIKGILMTAVLIPKGMIPPEEAGTVLKSNLGFLVDPLSAPVPFAVLSSIDVFNFWTLFLLALGVSIVSGWSRLRATLVVASLWMIVIGFKLIGAMMQSMRSEG